MRLNDFPVSASALVPQTISVDVLQEKYAKGTEQTIDEVQRRVAHALARAERPEQQARWAGEFLRAMQEGFVPAGRINSASGTEIRATLSNCFVQPVGDSVSDQVDGMPSIFSALAQAAETMRRGGGVGYDFSRIRPRGAVVKGTASTASGPVSYMRVFDRACETVESAGARRGAQMGILRCDHPDVLEFVHSKDDNGLSNFNISVGITDEFMKAVEADGMFDLTHVAAPSAAMMAGGAHQRSDGKWVYRSLSARSLMDEIVRSTYDHADPGVVFLDRMNAENNLHYTEVIEATNPCSEQSLPAYGCCCLGSIDLTRFVLSPFTANASFDWEGLCRVVRVAVRMLDNVLDVTFWPLPEQRSEALAKRRVGLGFLGLGSALVMLCVRYNSEEGFAFGALVAETMRDEAYRASMDLADEKGSFPALDAEQYLSSGFASRLPADIREGIRARGIRNSHLLSIAPTGTIALAFADNASNGIEPAFSWTYTRKKRMPDGSLNEYIVEDHAYRLYRMGGGDVKNLPKYFVSALDMTADQHMQMLVEVQPFIDSSISKTVNVPRNYPFEGFRDLYLEAWRAGLKGLATYRPNDVTGSVLSVQSAAPQAPLPAGVIDEDPLRKQFSNRPEEDLQGVTSKVEFWTIEGQKTVYLTINFMLVEGSVDGERVLIERPVEFFVPAGQRDEGQQWISSNMRLLSMVARSGGSIAKALASMREVVWDKGPVRCGTVLKADGATAPRFHDSEVAAIGYALQQILIKRGLLDDKGAQVPVQQLAARLRGRSDDELRAESTTPHEVLLPQGGKKCPECGAFALHKVDGCQRCTNCNHLGSCW